MKQLDLFQWADSRPSTVIQAQAKFQARAMAFVKQVIATGQMPPAMNGKVISPAKFQRERNVA